jgi:hypothetical protein
MAKARRLIVAILDKPLREIGLPDPDHELGAGNAPHVQIDLTGVANINSRVPLAAFIQERCELGCWHNRDAVELPCWGSD